VLNNYENFIELFEQETDKSLNNFYKHSSSRKAIFEEIIPKLALPDLFEAELIDNMIFSKQYP
jgi:hypothetical protein